MVVGALVKASEYSLLEHVGPNCGRSGHAYDKQRLCCAPMPYNLLCCCPLRVPIDPLAKAI